MSNKAAGRLGAGAVCALAAIVILAAYAADDSAADLALQTTSTTGADVARVHGMPPDADTDGLSDAGDPCPEQGRNACFGPVAVDRATDNPIRINAGAHDVLACARARVDCNGDLWLPDFGYRERGPLVGCADRDTRGPACKTAGLETLLGCEDAETQQIFRCGHGGSGRGRVLAYELDVAPGDYLVNFYFAAGAPRPPDRIGARGVAILVNDVPAYTRFDPADVEDATGAAVVRSALAAVDSDGRLRIELRGAGRRAAVRGLEVLSAATTTSTEANRESDASGGRSAIASPNDTDDDGLANAVDPCPTDPRNRCAGPLATETAGGRKLRLKAGVSSAECMGTKVDCNGETWLADFGYNQSAKAGVCNLNGGAENCVIQGIPALFGCEDETTEDIFQCEHADLLNPPELAYSFAVPNGAYVVNLFFANTFASTATAGSRVFDVRIEGATVYASFDQVAVAGGSGKAVVRSAVVNVADGTLQIDFVHRVENPAVKAIEVFAVAASSCTTNSQCNDGNACTTDTCNGGTCGYTQNTGSCPNDGNPCTADLCSTGVCTHPAQAGSCQDDLNPCTDDVCSGGLCAHLETIGPCADDANPCTSDVCGGGLCTHPANTAPCNDGLVCTLDDACSGGLCAGTSNCPSGQTCSNTTGQCVGGTGDSDNDGLAGADDLCPTDPRNRCAGTVAVDTATGKEIRLNCNVSSAECSGPKTDCAGNVWLGDFGYNQPTKAGTCNLGGGGEGCVITGIAALFGCDDETTEDIFQCEHSDPLAAPELLYSFTVPNGRYMVNLFFANTFTGTAAPANRVFDIRIEGATAYANFDQVAAAGGSGKAVVRSAVANVADGNGLQIELIHKTENPAIKAIEVLAVQTVTTCTTVSQCDDDNLCTSDVCDAGVCTNEANTLPCNDGVSCTSGDVCTSGVCRGTSTCPAGQTCNSSTGLCGAAQVSFGKSTLAGAALLHPTSLQFGPDGKLYVAQQDGLIKAYTIARVAPNNYGVTDTQTITSIQAIPNRNDDGTLNPGITKRLVTGLLVAGTAANPVIYAVSSDPRIGGGSNSLNTNLDTNSGVLSRLTWNGSSWAKVDLVSGLPRSEENHHGNGMALNAATSKLFIAYGGNTNQGATSNNFVLVPEYALSAAILSVDLAAIGSTTYEIPTLDDEGRPGVADAGDPFGGADGRNQARIVAGGPVQVHSPGWRNPYDVVITQSGKMYSIDNGANAGWGDVPVGNGTPSCTNEAHEPGQTFPDNLHLITGAGFYAGHPNPTRGNAANTFNATNPQSPVSSSNAVECTFRAPGVTDGALATFPASTNGMAEYRASNFAGQMKGDLLAAGWDNKIYRIKLNAAGTAVTSLTVLFSSVAVNSKPLDVIAQGDAGPFAGSIWATDYNGGTIIVYEAADAVTCSGQNSPDLDDDADGYSNSDEVANGTNPCSAADTPPDADGDLVSNLQDPDDDNDLVPDTSDPFARDAQNGKSTSLPIVYSWENDDPNIGGILNLGFTGLMTNGIDNYEQLFNPANVTSSGAAGVFTVDQVPEGDAFETSNSQMYGMQLGVNVTAATLPFTVHTRIVGPFLGITPQDFQSMGLFVGNGTQSDYVKLITSAIAGVGGVELVKETADVVTFGPLLELSMPGPEAVDLFLGVNPAGATVQGYFRVTDENGVTGPLTALGASMTVPASWFSNPTRGLAAGILATSRGAAPPFAATWDLFEITPGQPTCPDPDGDTKCSTTDPCPNDGLDDADADGICAGNGFNAPKTGSGDNCPSRLNAGQADIDGDGRGDVCDQCPFSTGAAEDACLGTGQWSTAAPATVSRSEVGMAAVAGKNYLVGGEQAVAPALEIYNPATNAWTTGPSMPSGRHHIQPVVVKNKIYVIGGLTGFPGPSLSSVLMFDPAKPGAGWQARAALPTSRGALSCAADGVKIFCAGGLSSATSETATNVMEVYDTMTNVWATLAPMPRARDHFQAAVIDGKFYAVGGRDTLISATLAFSDVYDIATNTWSSAAPIPTPRGGFSVAVVQGRLIVISGEGDGPVDGTFPQVEEYDPVRDVWRSLANIPTPRHGSGVALNTAPDGVERVYVAAGGPAQGNSETNAHQVFRY